MNTAESMTFIAKAEKYLVSQGAPKLLANCPWLELSDVKTLVGQSTLSKEQKARLREIPPLSLPTGSLTVGCPIEGIPISMALHYYRINEWVVNSLAVHYIDKHDIAMPVGLADEIAAL
jgi:hypothetical protein